MKEFMDIFVHVFGVVAAVGVGLVALLIAILYCIYKIEERGSLRDLAVWGSVLFGVVLLACSIVGTLSVCCQR